MAAEPRGILLTGYRGLAETFIDVFSGAGHRISVLVRNEEALPELGRRWPKVHFRRGDVRDQKTCRAWMEEAEASLGPLAALINNAAVPGPGGKLLDLEMAEIESSLAVNLVAPIFLTQLFLSRPGPLTVVNLSGGGATAGRPSFSPYAIAKTALVRLTETLAEEYPEHRFYSISPGGLMTPMIEAILRMNPRKIAPGDYAEAQRRAREGGEDPRKAAELALWLCENRPEALNGKLISAVNDDYRNFPPYPAKTGWWNLRRVDEICKTQLSELP